MIFSTHRTTIATAALFLALITVNQCGLARYGGLPNRGEHPLPLRSVGARPGLQMQLSWQMDQLRQILDPAALAGELVRNADDATVANALDSFLFVPAYAAFLVALAWLGLLLAGGDARLFTFTTAATGALAMADWLENGAIHEALRFLTGHSTPLRYQWPPDLYASDIADSALVKWALLVVVTWLIAAQWARVGRWWGRVVAVASGAAGLSVAAGLVQYALERW